MDKKQKKIVIIIVALIILVIFFYPKDCKTWGTANSPAAVYNDCACLGFKFALYNAFGAGSEECYGMPLSHSCYKAYNQTRFDATCP